MVELGIGVMVVWVHYYFSAAMCCLSLPWLLLLLFHSCVCLSTLKYVCLRVLVCSVIVEARRSVTCAE